jgi:tRNA threonylcarbamoyl adenosine modification protein YeaZ
LLALETSGAHMGVGVYAVNGEELKRLALHFEPAGSTQAELLIATIDRLFKKARCAKADVAAIAVDVGPGSFTGVRVGVATARALGQGLKKPVIGVDSLESVATESVEYLVDNVHVVASRPALQGDVYGAIYKISKGALTPVLKPAWINEIFFKRRVQKETKPGRFMNLFDRIPHPDAVARVAWARFLKGKKQQFLYERIEPLYLQPSWAERKKC